MNATDVRSEENVFVEGMLQTHVMHQHELSFCAVVSERQRVALLSIKQSNLTELFNASCAFTIVGPSLSVLHETQRPSDNHVPLTESIANFTQTIRWHFFAEL